MRAEIFLGKKAHSIFGKSTSYVFMCAELLKLQIYARAKFNPVYLSRIEN